MSHEPKNNKRIAIVDYTTNCDVLINLLYWYIYCWWYLNIIERIDYNKLQNMYCHNYDLSIYVWLIVIFLQMQDSSNMRKDIMHYFYEKTSNYGNRKMLTNFLLCSFQGNMIFWTPGIAWRNISRPYLYLERYFEYVVLINFYTCRK